MAASHRPSAPSDRALPTRLSVSTRNHELKQLQVKIAAREPCCGIEQIRGDLRTVEVWHRLRAELCFWLSFSVKQIPLLIPVEAFAFLAMR